MNRNEAISRLKAAEPQLRAKGITHLFLFGSFARDEAREGSDLDVLVEANDPSFFQLSNFTAAYQTLLGIFPGRDITYVTREALPGPMRSFVEQDALKVF